jgi:hypothetical protein
MNKSTGGGRTDALRREAKRLLPKKRLGDNPRLKLRAEILHEALSASETGAELSRRALASVGEEILQDSPATKGHGNETKAKAGPPAFREAPAERLPHNAAGRAELLRRVQEQGNPPLQDRFTDSKAPVDKYRKTSHNPPDMGLLHEYLRTTLGVPESLIPELAADIHALALARVKGEVAGRAAPVARGATQEKKTETPPLAAALEAMTLKDRRAALIEHYGLVLDKDGNYALPEEKKWANVRGENPTPEQFRAWLDAVFPDRQAIGMVLSDLKRLAPDAYGKLHTWANKKPAKATSDSFGLPSKRTSYDPTRDAIAPTELKNLRRSLGRAQYHHARLG